MDSEIKRTDLQSPESNFQKPNLNDVSDSPERNSNAFQDEFLSNNALSISGSSNKLPDSKLLQGGGPPRVDKLPQLSFNEDQGGDKLPRELRIYASTPARQPYSLPFTAEEEKNFDDRRVVSDIEHKLDLLTGQTGAPERFARDLAEQLSEMSQERINELGKMMEERKFVHVKRDENNNVVSISDNRRTPAWNNPHVGLLDAPFYYPAVGIIKGYKAAQHMLRGSDAEINIGTDKVTVHGRSYFDITGKGFLWGSDQLSVQRQIHPEK